MKNILITLSLLVMACACNRVSTPDGQIPAEYIEVAKNYTGTFSGNFEGTPGKLIISLEGTRAIARFEAASGDTDILGRGCASSINQLLAINPAKKDNQIRVNGAEFAFNPGSCYVANRVLYVSFKHTGSNPREAKVSVIEGYETQWREQCQWDAQGRQYCNRYAENVPVYLTGKFSK